MMFTVPPNDVLVPDDASLEQAVERTSQMGIGAHPDDLEIIAIPGILDCHGRADAWFTGLVLCDGAGSPRSGPYAGLSEADMIRRRREEQRDAARMGDYSLQLQLGYPSSALRAGSEALVEQLREILDQCRPELLYVHNPADAHATHRAAVEAALAALRRLESDARPRAVYGVEVWRSLDWLPEALRTTLPIADPTGLQAKLLRCHDSQISGGKRYDEAIIARQRANATLTNSHLVDQHEACLLAVDLSPLLEDHKLTLDDWLRQALTGFSAALLER